MSAECDKCSADLVYGEDMRGYCIACTQASEITRLRTSLENMLKATAGIEALYQAGVARATPNQPVGVAWIYRVWAARRKAEEAYTE